MKRLGIVILSLLATACCVIDDDLSVCDVDFVINYTLELRTDMKAQLEAELVADADSSVRQALEQWLSPVFTDKVKDVDLRFYLNETDEVAYLIKEEINDNRTSYNIHLPKENYMHLGVANIAGNDQVQLSGVEHSTSMRLGVKTEDKIPSMNTGVFTARLPMEVHDSISQSFTVHLYMVNAAVALVVDPSECADIVSISGLMNGASDGFATRDSTYSYEHGYMVIMDKVEYQTTQAPQKMSTRYAEEKPHVCLGAVTMPTEKGKKWQVITTTTLTDYRHTTTTLTLNEPLKAGELKIIQCKMTPTGEVDAVDSDVSVSVNLDWKPGDNHDLEL